MNTKTYILLALTFISLSIFGQVNDDSVRQEVLNRNVTDSLYIFGEWNETEGTETHLRYLGVIKTNKGNFKIMTSSWYWGLSKKVTSRILVFSNENEYLGNYYVGMTYDLPEKIMNNQIIFMHSESDDCDKKVMTHLTFENGIPEQFFLECKNGSGDIYAFDKK